MMMVKTVQKKNNQQIYLQSIYKKLYNLFTKKKKKNKN